MTVRADDKTRTQPPDPERGDFALYVNGPNGTRVHSLGAKRSLVLGRDPECDVVVDDETVSRRHASLVLSPPMIQDLGSHNGTFLGGDRLEPRRARRIEPGSAFLLGGALLYFQAASRGNDTTTATTEPIVVDPKSIAAYGDLDRFAASALNVLLLGETGVGKDVFARAIHSRSLHAKGPYLELNCAALPESILEAELFGYEKGTFAGATEARAGIFEAADGGTLFMDEVGELPLSTQAKLLRVLESREVMRLGSRRSKAFDVRFIAATNRSLETMVEQGAFRSDLYFRLKVITVDLAPLRERPLDIVPLAEAFLRRVDRRGLAFTEAAYLALRRYAWPGNVRELRNVIERAAVMSRGAAIEESDLALPETAEAPGGPIAGRGPSPTIPVPAGREAPLREQLLDFERARILEALKQTGGNKTRAAQRLGVTRSVLRHRMQDLGIAAPKGEERGEE
jgi:transcriptional regulator with PAS, ATPase and Fis domain